MIPIHTACTGCVFFTFIGPAHACMDTALRLTNPGTVNPSSGMYWIVLC